MHRLLYLASLLLGSCAYTGDRVLDVVDIPRVAIGVGSVGGARGRALGLVDTGLMFGIKPKSAALGLKYGRPLFFHEKDRRMDADQAEIIKTTHLYDFDIERGTYRNAWNSVALLPAIFTWCDSTQDRPYEWEVPEEGDDFDDRHYLWSAEGFRFNRFAQVHAFDLELEAGLFIYADLGVSPGEAVDFVFGLFLIDIAADDDRL